MSASIPGASRPARGAQNLQYPTHLTWSLRRLRQDPIAFLEQLASHGDVVPFSIGRRRAVLLNHPHLVERVLVTDQQAFAKGPAYERARRLLGHGLLTAEGDLHRRRRQVISPAFHRGLMETYARTIVAHSARLVEGWRREEAVDIGREMQRLALTISGETLFGARLNEGDIDEVRTALETAVASLDPLLSLLAPLGRVRAGRARLEAVVARFIADRQSSSAEGPGDLLSLLLGARAEGDNDLAQTLDDGITMLLAGHDTIANALTWVWALVACHPNVERRLHDELAGVLDGREPAGGDLHALHYTRAVVAEALRLYPPAWVIARRALVDCEFAGVGLSAGSLVILSQFLLHRDPRYFASPLSFDPDRWLGADNGARPKLAYFPFGAGPRSCIGESLAWLEAVLIVATVGQRVRLSSEADSMRVEPRVTLRPQSPVMMRVALRH